TVMGREFACQCSNDPKHPCTADIVTVPAGQVISGVDVKIVLHVITDQATLDGTADNPGFIDGHGVISAAHARDIAARAETVQRPLGNKIAPAEPAPAQPHPEPVAPAAEHTEPEPEQSEPERTEPAQAEPERAELEQEGPAQVDPGPEPEAKPRGKGTVYMRAPENPPIGEFADTATTTDAPFPEVVPLPATQPGDQYRPSVILDSYIRIRDCYCMWPGCEKKAWGADLDHTCEYNHEDPAAGGRTHSSEMKTLCRFHHLVKTYSDWLDDQYTEPRTGRTRLVFTTPEGKSYDGPAWTGDDLFPTLRLIVFDNQRGSPNGRPSTRGPECKPRKQSRIAAKHARRQHERITNRRLREEREGSTPPPTY
ncbi:MAG TPA: HNH endonuclease signature motif containing protein, partial [Williamsia sp.]